MSYLALRGRFLAGVCVAGVWAVGACGDSNDAGLGSGASGGSVSGGSAGKAGSSSGGSAGTLSGSGGSSNGGKGNQGGEGNTGAEGGEGNTGAEGGNGNTSGQGGEGNTGAEGGDGNTSGEGGEGNSTSGGTAGSGGSDAGTSGTSGSGGTLGGEGPGGAGGEGGGACGEGETRPCYTGPEGTLGVGPCVAGTETCAEGAWGTCADEVTPVDDICNDIDDDCDVATADGAHDARVAAPCDGNDSDLCEEGTGSCTGGAFSCSDSTNSTVDLCGGGDEDCDPASADGSEDPRVGANCDGADSDLCEEGTGSCADGIFSCSDVTDSTVDLCGGGDQDCDPASADGSEDPQLGAACDGTDTDLCPEGTLSCADGTLACSDATGSTLDLCGNGDDDCDPASADGSEDPQLGAACDGLDSDLCPEGTISCQDGTPACSDVTDSTVDLCGGGDQDCDAASADGSEDPQVGTACDGGDTDLCPEGQWACAGGVPVCSDNTGSTTDLCGGGDQDCDPASTDGSEDPEVGLACDGGDGDLCNEGTRTCTGGALGCSDNTGTTTEVCNATDDDCDGVIDDGIVRDDNPLCSNGTFFMGTVSGDTGAGVLNDSWTDEEWNRFSLTENNNDLFSTVYLSATIQLTSAPGTDFDLFVYCNNCTGGLAGSSTAAGGLVDTVNVRTNDDDFVSDSMDLIIEVRHWSSSVCAPWILTVTGNTAVTTETCN